MPGKNGTAYKSIYLKVPENEIERILSENNVSINSRICNQKIKKAYKNRYFIYVKNTL